MFISIEQAIQLILAGHIVGIPTETVYGLAASLKFPDTIKEIFSIKGRPNTKPLSVLIGTDTDLSSLAKEIPENFYKLKKFMPGPLTIILKANKENVPEIVRAGQDTVGVRMPAHPDLLELLKHTGPLAAPSANPSDHPPALSAQGVADYFGKDFPILDGGPCHIGKESTIVALNDPDYKILRHGAISDHDINLALH